MRQKVWVKQQSLTSLEKWGQLNTLDLYFRGLWVAWAHVHKYAMWYHAYHICVVSHGIILSWVVTVWYVVRTIARRIAVLHEWRRSKASSEPPAAESSAVYEARELVMSLRYVDNLAVLWSVSNSFSTRNRSLTYDVRTGTMFSRLVAAACGPADCGAKSYIHTLFTARRIAKCGHSRRRNVCRSVRLSVTVWHCQHRNMSSSCHGYVIYSIAPSY